MWQRAPLRPLALQETVNAVERHVNYHFPLHRPAGVEEKEEKEVEES